MIGIGVNNALLFRQLVADYEQEFDNDIYNLAVDLIQQIDQRSGQPFLKKIQGYSKKFRLPFEPTQLYWQVIDGNRNPISKSPGFYPPNVLPVSAETLRVAKAQKIAFETLDKSSPLNLHYHVEDPFRIAVIPFGKKTRGYAICVAAPFSALAELNRRMVRFNLAMLPLLGIFLGLSSFLLSGAFLRPLKRLLQELHSITPARIDVPVSVQSGLVEIQEISRSVNGLLERLNLAFDAQDRFVVNAAHQLQTPLTVLLSELEGMRRSDIITKQELEDIASRVVVQIQDLSKLVNRLLQLSQLQARGPSSISFGRVAMRDLILDMLERLSPIARKRSIRFDFQVRDLTSIPRDGVFEVRGDAILITSLLESLLENALKYSPGNSSVGVYLEANDTQVIVSVADEADRIPEAIQDSLFKRHYRGTYSVRGHGLGLAIAKEIADAHGFEIELSIREKRGNLFKVLMKRTDLKKA